MTSNYPKHWLRVGLLLACLVLVTFGPTLSFSEFVYDDKAVVKNNPVVRGPWSLSKILFTDWWGQPPSQSKSAVYRPVTSALLWVEYQLFGVHSAGYKGLNLLWFWGVCFLLFLWVQHIGLSFWCAIVGSTLFCIHPVHTDVIASISGRADMMATLFFFLALLFHSHRKKSLLYSILAFIAVAFGLGSKEFFVVFVALVGVFDLFQILQTEEQAEESFFQKWKRRLRALAWGHYAGYIVLTAGFLLLRFKAIGGFAFAPFTHLDNPLLVAPLWERWLNVPVIFWNYVQLLLSPTALSFDRTAEAVTLLKTPWAWSFWAGLSLTALLFVAFWFYRRRPIVVLLGSFFLIFYFPLSNTLLAATAPVADRWLFLPSIPYCIALSLGFLTALEYLKDKHTSLYRLGIFSMGAYFLLLTAISHHYTWQWRSHITLYAYAIQNVPNSLKVRDLYAQALIKQKRYKEALVQYNQLIRRKPNFLPAYFSAAQIFEKMGRINTAKTILYKVYRRYGKKVPEARQSWQAFLKRHPKFQRTTLPKQR